MNTQEIRIVEELMRVSGTPIADKSARKAFDRIKRTMCNKECDDPCNEVQDQFEWEFERAWLKHVRDN